MLKGTTLLHAGYLFKYFVKTFCNSFLYSPIILSLLFAPIDKSIESLEFLSTISSNSPPTVPCT